MTVSTATPQRPPHPVLHRIREKIGPYSSSDAMQLALGGLVGVATGALAWLLIWSLRHAQQIAFGSHPSLPRTVLAPTIGALVVGVLATYWASEPSGGGIVETMRSIPLRAGRMRSRVPLAVLVESGLALGTGGSGGREAPIVLGGGSLGSLIGQVVGVDEDRMRTLVAAGAAAGIGASFNAPIGGMLFAIELFMRRLRAGSLQVIVLAAVAGSVTARELVGEEVAFAPSHTYKLNDPRELIGYAAIGILAVGVGVAFLYGERWGHDLFHRLKVWPPLKFMLGGLIVGVIALLMPEVLGTGHLLPPIFGEREPIQTMVDGGFGTGWAAVEFLLLLFGAKLVASLTSVTSGNAVGSLMPTLFTGAALGGAVGHLLTVLLPNAGVDPGAFALVGMAAGFAAAARTPLTAIIIVFEMTNDYQLVIPLMLAAGLATFLTDRISPDGIYTDPLVREGIVFDEPQDIDVMQTIRVGEVMTTSPPVLQASMTLAECRAEFEETRHHGFAVCDGDRLIGVLTLTDLERAEGRAGPRDLVAADVATKNPLTVTPEDPVFRGLHRMAAYQVGRLPVVASDDTGRLVGLLRRNDIVEAYQRAVHRSVAEQQRRQRSQLRDLTGVQFVEFVISADAPAAGHEVHEMPWPAGTILTSIRRRGEVVLPRGDTQLLAGDEVVALVTASDMDDVKGMLSPNGADETAG